MSSAHKFSLPETKPKPSAWDPAKIAPNYNMLVRPTFVDKIRPLGLDVVFHRAAGDYLYYYDRSGNEVGVLDMVGGSGATILGHNDPNLIARATSLLANGIPFHGQRSVRRYATELAVALNGRLGRETRGRYVISYANSGSEANELAVKHAHFERQVFLDAWHDRIFGSGLTNAAREHNDRTIHRPLVFVAMEDGFHGKTNVSLALSHSPAIKVASHSQVQPAVYLRPNSVQDLQDKLTEYETTLYYMRDGAVAELPYTPVLGVICEPILGDGGIVELDDDYLDGLRRWTARFGVPLVFDEIQSGVGRTGTFLASSSSGVVADYYTLSKALSGGIGKISVLAVDVRRFVSQFALVHSSTYNEDDWSCAIALRTIELLDERHIYRQARETGEDLRNRLVALMRTYPDLITGIRGRGLMLGIEWNPEAMTRIPSGAHLAQHVEGILFVDYGVRVGTAIATPFVTRLTPSALLDEDSIDMFIGACDALCRRFLWSE